MKIHFQHFLRAVILAAFAIFFMKIHVTGDITKYINPKYELISQICAGIFIFLFFVQLTRIWESRSKGHQCSQCCSHDHEHSASLAKKLFNYSIIIFPLLTGFTFSPTVLDASIAEKKGTMLPQANANNDTDEFQSQGNVDQSIPLEEDDGTSTIGDLQEGHIALPNNNILTEDEYLSKMEELSDANVIQMNEDMFFSYYETISADPKAYIGRKIKLTGFVYKEEGFKENQLVVSRFNITHCIADAAIIGFLTEFEQASQFEPDTWLEMKGTLDVTTYNGVEIPMIKAKKWRVVERPEEPYVYPVITKVR